MKKSILKNYPRVVLIGRTNVGKSTLFNRLIEEKKALISPIAGTTRDLNYALCTWQGVNFYLVDTGGLDVKANEEIEKNVVAQTRKALEEADLAVMMIDAQSGILPSDRNISKEIIKSKKPYLTVINKVKRSRYKEQTDSVKKLGLGEGIGIAALSGMGTGDLLDEIIKKLKKVKIQSKDQKKETPIIPVAIIGKPNVGKSSILNVLAGEERMVVSAEAFTTREPQDTLIKHGNYQYLFLDTVGMRKKRKVGLALEREGTKMSRDKLKEAEVIILVIDISQPISAQDIHLMDDILKLKKGLIIVANKWDLVEDKSHGTIKKEEKKLRRYLSGVAWAPVIFTSAKTKQRVRNLYDLIVEINENWERKIDTNELDKFLKKVQRSKDVSHPLIYGLKQVDTKPPEFNLSMTRKTEIHPAYANYLEKRLRENYAFEGTPMEIHFRRIRPFKK